VNLFDGDEEASRDELALFIGERLTEAGIWESPRVSDGISTLRAVERTHCSVRFCGQIWDIGQTLHTFWLDIEQSNNDLAWTLHFDPLIDSPRRARNIGYALAHPDEVEWRSTLSGRLEANWGTR